MATTKEQLAAAVDEMVRQYEEGDGPTAIARRFDLDHSTVIHHLRRRGVPRRPPARPQRHPHPLPIEVIQLYERGVTITELARRFHRSEPTIRVYLRANNIPLRRSSPPRQKPRRPRCSDETVGRVERMMRKIDDIYSGRILRRIR